jgi:predicted nucleic acid-binding protein
VSPTRGLAVVDSSAIVALLADRADTGEWVRDAIGVRRIAAPRLMVFEAGNTIRRKQLAGALDSAGATRRHTRLCDLRVLHWPHSRLATRAWELRNSVTYYDATYVALAELLDAPLITLDRRLAQAHGPHCAFLTPPESPNREA